MSALSLNITPQPVTLWDSQQYAVEQLREGIRQGHRAQMLYSPTGSGKTIIGGYLMQEVFAKGKRAAFITDLVAINRQTSRTFTDLFGLTHGIAQGENTRDRSEPLQIASIQTIEKRGFWPDADLIIIDEAHSNRQAIKDYIAASKKKPNCKKVFVGLSATPFTRGLGLTYTRVVNAATHDALVTKGKLVPLKIYAAKQINMEGLQAATGEWSAKDVGERGTVITGDALTEWVDKTRLHFGGPVKTLVFTATIAQGEEVCRQFQAAGFNFQQVSYKDGNGDAREALLDEFAKPDSAVMGLVSCSALGKGYDCPSALCGISLRPYKKGFAAHIQELGRLPRSHPGKDYALWLDHTGNYLGFHDRMLDLFADGVSSLDQHEHYNKPRVESVKEKVEISCVCGFVLEPAMPACPSCGKERLRKNKVRTVAGYMVELEAKPKKEVKPYLRNRREAWKGICSDALRRKKGDAAEANRFALGQYKQFYNCWPSYKFEPGHACDVDLAKHIKGNLIRYAKGQAKRRAA